MPQRHYIQKLVVAGEPYVNSDDLADWIGDLNWQDSAAKRAAQYIAQELRLMGLADAEESLK
ncbi:hypothetical protein GCM10027174_32940 [Salinifilum aidingensis]